MKRRGLYDILTEGIIQRQSVSQNSDHFTGTLDMAACIVVPVLNDGSHPRKHGISGFCDDFDLLFMDPLLPLVCRTEAVCDSDDLVKVQRAYKHQRRRHGMQGPDELRKLIPMFSCNAPDQHIEVINRPCVEQQADNGEKQRADSGADGRKQRQLRRAVIHGHKDGDAQNQQRHEVQHGSEDQCLDQRERNNAVFCSPLRFELFGRI